MASLISRIKRIITPKQEKRCPVCKRNLHDAITEQVSKKQLCGVNECPFKQEIEQAILYSRKPELIHWYSDKNIVFNNEDLTLSWEVKYAKSIEISHLQEVEEQGNLTIRLQENTDFNIKYESFDGNTFESDIISIKVIPFPIIYNFSGKNKIEIDDLLKLNWQVSNALKIEIYNGINYIDVTNVHEYETYLSIDTTFKLIVTALDNITTIEKEIIVQVFEKPKIIFFNAEPDVVLDCEPVTLSWRVLNAKRIVIDNGIGDVEAEGNKKSLLYKKHTLFTLVAEGELSTRSAEVVVRIFPTPIIESLKVPMPDFESRISLNPIIIISPKIDVAINMPDFNFNVPKFTTPNVDINKIKPKYKSKVLILNFSKIYEHIRRKF